MSLNSFQFGALPGGAVQREFFRRVMKSIICNNLRVAASPRKNADFDSLSRVDTFTAYPDDEAVREVRISVGERTIRADHFEHH